MLARDLMSKPAITITQESTLAEAAKLLIEKRIGGLAIVDDQGHLVGILTISDFAPREANVPHSDVRAVQVFRRWLGPGGIEAAYTQTEELQVKEVMNRDPITATEDEHVEAIAVRMVEYDVNHVPIVREGRVVGMITRHDFLRLAAGTHATRPRGS